MQTHHAFPALRAVLLTGTLGASVQTLAMPISIVQFSAFLFANELGPVSLEQTPIGFYSRDDFVGSGVDVTFSSGLDPTSGGTVTWDFVNRAAGSLTDARLFVFLDAEIDEGANSFFNESGRLEAVNGNGAADRLPDSWEIDEPGFLFGDIFDNLRAGALDNSNAVPVGFEDDVSLALGWELGSLAEGDSWTASITLSQQNIGGLSQWDADSGTGFYLNGAVERDTAAPVPASSPSSVVLLLFGVGSVLLRMRRQPSE